MDTGLRIDDEARLTEVRWNRGQALAPLQQAVGGLVDVVELAPGLDMWVNDDGAMYAEINGPATRLARLRGLRHQPYWGPVVITGQKDGEAVGLPAAVQAWLTGWLKGRCTAIYEEFGRATTCAAISGHQGTHGAVLEHQLRLWVGEPMQLDELLTR